MKSKRKFLNGQISLCGLLSLRDLMLFLVVYSVTVQAQNNFVNWSNLNMGFAESKTSNTMVKSVVGQTFVGVAQQANTQIVSGFLVDTLFRAILTAVHDQEGLPLVYSLEQNYPNPFNPTTRIQYDLPVAARVRVIIYNMMGQVVATLVDAMQDAGFKSIEWNAASMASGVYFCRIEATSTSGEAKVFRDVKKLVLLK